MSNSGAVVLAAAVATVLLAGWVYGGPTDELSIYDVQYTTASSGISPYHGQIHNVDGGIVVHKWAGFNHRLYLQDPAHPTWGAIVVKDWEFELLAAVEIGDWVSFDNILIEDFRGTTFLQYNKTLAPNVTFTIESSGNAVPNPNVLSAASLAYPITDHLISEPYESMVVTLENVRVGQKGLGKSSDDYELWQNGDTAWGSDYMNIEAGATYDPRILTGVKLTRITGVVEQYTRDAWDYYQLLTRSADDIQLAPVPTASAWAAAWASLSLLTAGTVAVHRRRHVPV